MQISGEIRIPTSALATIAKHIQLASTIPTPKVPERPSEPERLAYTVTQTAVLLGVAKKTVYRLLARGLLHFSAALRHKRIPRSEINRFLNSTLTLKH